ncbi:MAG TPA: hypothetical protein VK502_03520 [Candidatus Saccharimonadales bacterium]|nr:hypothetical protein [Candidatus Saccharimonadales bacterium]
MNYGKGAAPSVAGVALLPFTGDNGILFIIAASLIALGVAVFVVSLVLARKSRQTSAN